MVNRKRFANLLGYTWLLMLAATVVTSALIADRRARQIEEYPCCCDPFGYLQMAKDIREARQNGKQPNFTIETDQTRLLIQLMQSHPWLITIFRKRTRLEFSIRRELD